MNIREECNDMWYRGFAQFEQFADWPCYLAGIGHHDLQPPVFRPNGLDRHQLLYCEKGRGMLKIAGKEMEIGSQSGFYIPANVPHEYYPLEDRWDVRWISCGGAYVEELFGRMDLQVAKVYSLSNTGMLDTVLDRMRTEESNDPSGGYYMVCSYVDTFITEFCHQAGIIGSREEFADIYEKNYLVLKDYIEQNYMRDIPLEELSALLCVTPQHLCRIFKKCSYMRPVQYLNQVRLQHAEELLVTSEYPIGQIAQWCGYENANYFGKLFKQQKGMTPTEFRMHFRGHHNFF